MSPTTISPFLLTTYATLLTTTLTKISELSSLVSAQKNDVQQTVTKTHSEIASLLLTQKSVNHDMPHSEIDAIYTKRAELGKAISVLAMLDAVLDNHAFGVVLLGKRVEEAKKRVEGFAEAKEKRGGKKRKLTAYHGDGAKKDWNDLMKRVEQLIDETGTLELAVETMVSGEVEEKSEKSSPGIEEGDGKSSDDGDGEGEDVEIENSD